MFRPTSQGLKCRGLKKKKNLGICVIQFRLVHLSLQHVIYLVILYKKKDCNAPFTT